MTNTGNAVALAGETCVSVSKISQFEHTSKPKLTTEGMTIWETLADHDLVVWSDVSQSYRRVSPFVVNMNGTWLLADDGDFDKVTHNGDVIRVEILAGGKKGGGSKGLGIIIAIVAIVAAPFTGGASLWLLVASASLVMAGMTGIPKPAAANTSGKDSTSPTYSMQAQGNQARLLSTVPKLFGTVKFTPDLASQPYTEFQGNDQWLFELFCLTCGECEFDLTKDVYIDETLTSQFNDIYMEKIEPYQPVTLFPDNVVSSAAVDGITLENGTIAGPYIVGLPGTKTTTLGYDFVFPSGCYTVDDAGNTQSMGVKLTIRAQLVDDAGVAYGPILTIAEGELNFATRQPQRVSNQIPVAPGRYTTWIIREGPDFNTNNRIQNVIQWTGLRAYLKADVGVNYGNVTLLAVKMKSSEVLNSNTARKFSVRATGKTRRWTPLGGWGQLVANNDIAWAAADVLHDSDYGRGMPSDRIDLAGLVQLQSVWASRGDTFNGLFDNKDSVWAVLSKILRAGRAAPMYYAGRVEFIRDAPQYLPVAMFQPRNIVQGSFSVDHNWPTDSTPDYVIAEYFDKETWSTKQVDCILANQIGVKGATIELFGVTDRDQAYREGMFIAASNRYRRRTIRFSTELEGQVLRYNDLIQISHDVADWGYSGVVYSFNPQTGVIRTSEPLPNLGGRTVIAFRKKDGSAHGPFDITPDPTLEGNTEVFGGIVGGKLADRQAIYISTGVRSDYTMYQFGPVGRAGLKALVRKVTPRGNDLYNIECLGDVPAIHYAENGGVIPFPESPSNLVKPPVGPIVDRISVKDTVEPGQQAVQFTPATGAQYYEVEYELNGGPWMSLFGSTQRTSFFTNLPRGNHGVRVRGVGTVIAGPWATWHGEITGSVLGLPALLTFTATPRLMEIQLDWTFTADTKLIADYTTVIVSSSPIPGPGNSQIMGEYKYPATTTSYKVDDPGTKLYFFAAVTDRSGRQGPFFNDMTAVEGRPNQDPAALLEMLVNQIDQSQLTQRFRDELGSLMGNVDGLQTAVDVITQEITNDREAFAQYKIQVEAAFGDTNSSIAQIITEVEANIDGAMKSIITMRTQVRADGRLITAGIGIGVVPDFDDPTQHNSEIILQAGRIAFTTNQLNDPTVAPMVIQGNSVYMHGAFIAELTVNTAQIADVAISTAKIQFLAVTTLKIQGQAITVPRYAKNPGAVGQGTGVWFKLIGIDITMPEYNGTFVIFSTGFNTSGAQRYGMQMRVNGTVVRQVLAYWSDTSLNMGYGDYFNAGTQLIEVWVYGEDGNCKFMDPSLLVQGAMR